MTGRPRKPNHLKVLEGETRPSQLTNEPIPDDEMIELPLAIAEDDIAADLWHELAPRLIKAKVLTTWDVPLFVELCKAYSFMRQARDHLDAGGVLLEQPMHNGSSRVVKSPAHQVYRDNLDIMMRLAARFGITPTDRAKLDIGTGQAPGALGGVADFFTSG